MSEGGFYIYSKRETQKEASFSKPPPTDVIWFMVAIWHCTFFTTSLEKTS